MRCGGSPGQTFAARALRSNPAVTSLSQRFSALISALLA
jgi:hypothetical protein